MNGNVDTVLEPARRVPVIRDVDVCVLGGGCTGAFAAVRADRLGARVALVEKQNALGCSSTPRATATSPPAWTFPTPKADR